MKKRRKRLLLFITVCAAITIGYMIWPKGEATTLPPKQSTVNEGTIESGGEVQGELGAGNTEETNEEDTGTANDSPDNQTEAGEAGAGDATAAETASPDPDSSSNSEQTEDGMAVVAQPESVAALVNKQNKLPEDYSPSDLVYPDVRFIFNEKVDKRKMRKEAAAALEKMFKAAEDDNIQLAGVSAYRSHETQTTLFERYVERDGLEKARTYSAFPGTSEHETGLAIDVSGSDGKCAAADCFADTDEAIWLEQHAHEYGFIIRYLEGKEEITGYQYEPWHLRFVGTELAAELEQSGETLEEYYDAVPVTK